MKLRTSPSLPLHTSIILLIILILFINYPHLASASSLLEEDSTSKKDLPIDTYEYFDLDGMSDEELEYICTSRGFELAEKDDDIVYPHQYYVDAAWECLQIEAEM
jgi:hypothetical protein